MKPAELRMRIPIGLRNALRYYASRQVHLSEQDIMRAALRYHERTGDIMTDPSRWETNLMSDPIRVPAEFKGKDLTGILTAYFDRKGREWENPFRYGSMDEYSKPINDEGESDE